MIHLSYPVNNIIGKKKRKKARKLASKLKISHSKGLNVKIAKGKRSSELSLSARPGYAQLGDGMWQYNTTVVFTTSLHTHGHSTHIYISHVCESKL